MYIMTALTKLAHRLTSAGNNEWRVEQRVPVLQGQGSNRTVVPISLQRIIMCITASRNFKTIQAMHYQLLTVLRGHPGREWASENYPILKIIQRKSFSSRELEIKPLLLKQSNFGCDL